MGVRCADDYLQAEYAAQAGDPVNHPPHYTAGNVECIDAIEAALGPSFADYCRGQVIKYVWRAGLKADALEDAKKAEWYLKRMIATMEQK